MAFSVKLPSGASRSMPHASTLALGRRSAPRTLLAGIDESVGLSDSMLMSSPAITLNDLPYGIRVTSLQKASAGEVTVAWLDESLPLDVPEGKSLEIAQPVFRVRLALRTSTAGFDWAEIEVAKLGTGLGVITPHEDTVTGRSAWFGIELAPAWAQLAQACCLAVDLARGGAPQKRVAVRCFSAMQLRGDLDDHRYFETTLPITLDQLSLAGRPTLATIARRFRSREHYDPDGLMVAMRALEWREAGGRVSDTYGGGAALTTSRSARDPL